ncbi:MAG: winged helix-turn-helix domain-containing protein [Victivallaceae bacterium]|nr:winged helix-turn-helix domain-containing protein [Victivallaceae bacterium]
MNQPMKSVKLIDSIREYIISGQYHPDSKIPSIREFADRFNLSFGSVNRGIDYLVSQGLLEKRHGQGTFVVSSGRERTKSAKYIISIFYANINHKGYCGKALVGIQDYALANNCSLSINYVNFRDLDKAAYAFGIKNTDGSIFLGPYDNSPEKINILLPTVGLAMHDSCDGKISTMDIDPVSTAELACRYFKDKGIKHLNVIGHYYKNYKFRHEIFIPLWEASGGKVKLTIYPEWDQIRSGEAYFFTSASVFQDYSLKQLEKTSRILSETNTVLTIDGQNLIDPSYHYAPTISIDWKLAGELLIEECIKRIRNPGSPVRRCYVYGHLFEQ